MLGLRLAQGGKHLAPQPEHVPVERIKGGDSAVGETVHYFQAEPIAVKRADQSAARFGAQIESQDFCGGHDG